MQIRGSLEMFTCSRWSLLEENSQNNCRRSRAMNTNTLLSPRWVKSLFSILYGSIYPQTFLRLMNSRCMRKCAITWKSWDSFCSALDLLPNLCRSLCVYSFLTNSQSNEFIWWLSMQNINRCQFYAIQSSIFNPFRLHIIKHWGMNDKQNGFPYRICCESWSSKCDVMLW